MIEANNFSVFYNQKLVFENYSFQIPKGSRVCIVGPNGCGKSSILKAIAGLIPYQGKLLLNEIEISNWKSRERASIISMLPQIMSTSYFSFSVYDTLMQGAYAQKLDFLAIKQKAETLIQEFELDNIRQKPITELSGGQLQRVFLARTFLRNADIFLLDEPTSYLDPKYEWDFLRFLLDLNYEEHKSIVCVFHDLHFVLSFATHILLLGPENFSVFGTIEKVFTKENLKRAYSLNVVDKMNETSKKWISFFD